MIGPQSSRATPMLSDPWGASTASPREPSASATSLNSADLAALEKLEETANKVLAAARIDLMSAAYRVFTSSANVSKRSLALRVQWIKRLETLVRDLSRLLWLPGPTALNGSSPCEPPTS